MTEVQVHDRQNEEVVTDAPRSSRGKFLKRLGLTLAAGIGVAGVLASSAFATPGRCCVVSGDTNCTQTGCGSCSGGCICKCDCTGIGESYCWTGHCLSPGQCVNCPC